MATYSDEGSRNVVALAVVTLALRLSQTIAFGTPPRNANVLIGRANPLATPRRECSEIHEILGCFSDQQNLALEPSKMLS